MKNMKIKIKEFEIYADPDDQESMVDAIIQHIEEVAEDEKFFSAKFVDDGDESYEDEEQS